MSHSPCSIRSQMRYACGHYCRPAGKNLSVRKRGLIQKTEQASLPVPRVFKKGKSQLSARGPVRSVYQTKPEKLRGPTTPKERATSETKKIRLITRKFTKKRGKPVLPRRPEKETTPADASREQVPSSLGELREKKRKGGPDRNKKEERQPRLPVTSSGPFQRKGKLRNVPTQRR